MNVMGGGLEKLSGSKLERILENLTNNPLKGVLVGAGVTAIIQSSSGHHGNGGWIRKLRHYEA